MLTPEGLTKIEELASCFFTDDEIITIMGLSAGIQDEQIQRAMKRGRLMSEAEIRKSIFDLAKSGSGPAQVLAVQIMKDYHLMKVPL